MVNYDTVPVEFVDNLYIYILIIYDSLGEVDKLCFVLNEMTTDSAGGVQLLCLPPARC